MTDKKNRILLVEDDINLGTVLKEYLEIKNFYITLKHNGKEALLEYSNEKYELILLDIMMPEMDGYTVAKEIRKIDDLVPVIFLTAKSQQQDKIEGFLHGADDYITKPFNVEELLLRIKAVLKRTSKSKPIEINKAENIFKIGSFLFDYNQRTLIHKKKEIILTTKEADLLRLLCINKNELLERTFALKEIWGKDDYFTARSMDVYIAKIRNYLKNDTSVKIINVHSTGYKLLAS